MSVSHRDIWFKLMLIVLVIMHPDLAVAHASEGGFVLLLPTDVYIFAGAASVALTVVFLAVLPDHALPLVFHAKPLWWIKRSRLHLFSSGLSFLFLMWLVHLGLTGPRDPLANPLPLTIWTLFWVAFVILQGVLGNAWYWVNPWSGPLAFTRKILKIEPLMRLPSSMGHCLSVFVFLLFVSILLADPAPADPARLARYVIWYWMTTFVAALVFGPRWMRRGEAFTVFLTLYARLGLFARRRGRLHFGFPGWQVFSGKKPAFWLAVFVLVMLGSGSFDGLNETFWWLDVIGINPLEYPGRSAVIVQNMSGLAVANVALISAYCAMIWLGLKLARTSMTLNDAFCHFAPTLLPIALAYHFAHYYTSFLVDAQYALAAATDPMATGADYLGLGTFYVTTGFFNSQDSVRLIWLTQAGSVVLGHILAVMLAHGLAVRHFGETRRAALSQAPLAMFMILYTFFGLWLLASPRGF
ncbi:hypothetical protein [Shimia abyssi]|uniref:Uncharacterized protein n=1 Tax=Shimia abyssi TaxID=1662395 RepID=A0A2P8F653_9RHOB|nr:hypothetical protein [Shimia abyssi]PSL17196.1 hypothetical protein CLV88_12048 [Shimia abyssi]